MEPLPQGTPSCRGGVATLAEHMLPTLGPFLIVMRGTRPGSSWRQSCGRCCSRGPTALAASTGLGGWQLWVAGGSQWYPNAFPKRLPTLLRPANEASKCFITMGSTFFSPQAAEWGLPLCAPCKLDPHKQAAPGCREPAPAPASPPGSTPAWRAGQPHPQDRHTTVLCSRTTTPHSWAGSSAQPRDALHGYRAFS